MRCCGVLKSDLGLKRRQSSKNDPVEPHNNTEGRNQELLSKNGQVQHHSNANYHGETLQGETHKEYHHFVKNLEGRQENAKYSAS